MIILNPPVLKDEDDMVLISSVLEIKGEREELWYSIPKEFKKYLVIENLDAFLVGILFLGLKTGSDIHLNAAVSARLFYTIEHYLIPALVFANPHFTKIKITSNSLNYDNTNIGGIAGTGMSLGIDSFATYLDHKKENSPFKIEYFTFFNVGSHLDFGGKKARLIFQKRLKAVKDFALEEGKQVIPVDSNLSEILKMNFQQTHSLRSVSCVLLLQKLFKNYYYSSAYRFDHFKFNSRDTSDYDFLILNLLNTESTTFFASAAQYSRVERTLTVSDFPPSFEYLDVCTDPPLKSDYINCSECYKCMRTQLTLELAGKLEKYNKIFNLEVYYKQRENYIGRLMLKNKTSILDNEVKDFMKRKKINPSVTSYYHLLNALYKTEKKRLKQILRRN